jgi:hypothetical protein
MRHPGDGLHDDMVIGSKTPQSGRGSRQEICFKAHKVDLTILESRNDSNNCPQPTRLRGSADPASHINLQTLYSRRDVPLFILDVPRMYGIY